MTRFRGLGIVFGCCCAWLWIVIATAESAEPDNGIAAAATVDGDPVYVSEVRRELARVIGPRQMDDAARQLLLDKTREQLVDRRLIVHSLTANKQGASAADVDQAIAQLTAKLKQREITFEQHLEQVQMTEAELRRLLEWQLGWQRYLARYLTDENLAKYFDQHRRDFDGTRLRVAHILWKVDPPTPTRSTSEENSSALQKAEQVRQQIKFGTITFEEAAREHSSAPTAEQRGDIGFISRHAPMPESFSQAAFALQVGEVSAPVTTAFGVHLIRCLEIEGGPKLWTDARDELQTAVTQYLFTRLAGQLRPQAKIEYKEPMKFK